MRCIKFRVFFDQNELKLMFVMICKAAIFLYFDLIRFEYCYQPKKGTELCHYTLKRRYFWKLHCLWYIHFRLSSTFSSVFPVQVVFYFSVGHTGSVQSPLLGELGPVLFTGLQTLIGQYRSHDQFPPFSFLFWNSN